MFFFVLWLVFFSTVIGCVIPLSDYDEDVVFFFTVFPLWFSNSMSFCLCGRFTPYVQRLCSVSRKTLKLVSLSSDTLSIKCGSRQPDRPLQEEKREEGEKKYQKEAWDMGMTSPSWPAHENQMFSAAPSPPIFRHALNTPRMQESHVVTFRGP